MSDNMIEISWGRVASILRNPYGHSEDRIRYARLAAADRIEQLEAELAEAERKQGFCFACSSELYGLKAQPTPPPSAEDAKDAAILAMVEDGWLDYGSEGMSDAQEKCYEAYIKIKAARGEGK